MGRLFWKIFIWFCLALALITTAVGWGVKLYVELAEDEYRQEVPATQATALTVAIEQNGIDHARELLNKLASESRRPLFILDDQGRDILHRHLPPRLELMAIKGMEKSDRFIIREAIAPSGQRLRVVVPRFGGWKPHHPKMPRAPVWLSISIALFIGLLVCFWLARYLSRPVAGLSRASRALADGDLDSRVGSLGGRKDEIADLARDFDAMAERIQHLLQSQKQLLSDISHELRSPLARLQVAIALARRHSDGGDSLALDRIERDVERMETLISELLTLFRLDSTDAVPLDQVIDLAAFLEGLAEDNRLEAGAKGCRINLNIQGELRLKGNAELLRRAFENTIRNAIHYTTSDTVIDIEARQEEAAALTVTVCDRGPGVEETALATLFDPFVRTDSARERRTGGYGLGLAIARRAIEIHRGTIAAMNRTDGKGLCILIRLPTTGTAGGGSSRD